MTNTTIKNEKSASSEEPINWSDFFPRSKAKAKSHYNTTSEFAQLKTIFSNYEEVIIKTPSENGTQVEAILKLNATFEKPLIDAIAKEYGINFESIVKVNEDGKIEDKSYDDVYKGLIIRGDVNKRNFKAFAVDLKVDSKFVKPKPTPEISQGSVSIIKVKKEEAKKETGAVIE